MARDLSANQKKIVQRYYDNHETIQTTKLAEIASELWLAEDPKARKRLWGRAEKALLQLRADPGEVAGIVASDNAEALAKLITRLEGGGQGNRPGGDGPHASD